ncbi:hypothetical protein FA95DRAFT_1506105, partial [Auriscalpium vulgare]
LEDFIPFRDMLLDELIRHEGIGEASNCRKCGIGLGAMKCVDCVSVQELCEDCIVEMHSAQPLHRVKRWNGAFFENHTLRKAGLRTQLGHDGLPCPNPLPKDGPLVVVDVSGIHEVHVNYCACGIVGSSRPIVQLLRAGWWPATTDRPRTVVTFAVLNHFHALNLQGKVNMYDYYQGLVRLVDGTGTRTPKYRYKEFTRSVRLYRHIHAAKRSGRAHDPDGIRATTPGQLVVDCPLCPRPGRNLPEGWDALPEDESWKYALYLAVDANFKLKRKKKRARKDIELSPGWSYFVADGAYKAHLKNYRDEPEMKHCDSNHSAVDHANTPAQARFAVNGVGAVICSRHCFYHTGCIGDLQKGERYSNMDYMVLSMLRHALPGLKSLFISYDIACSYSKNFHERLKRYASDLQLDLSNINLTWNVPKFHLLAHGRSCQVEYALEQTRGTGRTHGEGIEAGWAEINPAALSSREMSSSTRHELLDDVLGAVNWRKLTRIGTALRKNLRQAVTELKRQRSAFEEYTAMLPAELTTEWEAMVRAWDKDRTKPNPYDEPITTTTLTDVKLAIANEEAEEAARGLMALHETTASSFIMAGMDLEEQQYVPVNCGAAAKGKKTDIEKATFRQRQNTLHHRIQGWRKIQLLYMPGVSRLLNTGSSADPSPDDSAPMEGGDDNLRPETIRLYLPSAIPPELRTAGCAPGLVEKELCLRRGDAEDTLHHIRRLLRIRLGLVHYKHIHVDGPGQKANTRARAHIQRLSAKLDRYVARYRATHATLLTLDPDGDWQQQLRPLRNDHVRGPRKEDNIYYGMPEELVPKPSMDPKAPQNRRSEGRHEIPWIWRVLRHEERDLPRGDDSTTQAEVHESARVDWVKAKARVDRWDEEIQKTVIEMECCIRDLEWRQKQWLSNVDWRGDARPDIVAGLNAYARRQAGVYGDIARLFVHIWREVFGSLNLPPPIWDESAYPPMAQKQRNRGKDRAGVEVPAGATDDESGGSEEALTSEDERFTILYSDDDEDL